jgi:MFS family permease
MMMLIMPISGLAYDRFGARWPGVAGVLLAGLGTALLSGFSSDMTRGQVVVWTMIQSAGLALSFMPIMTAGLAALPAAVAEAGNAYTNLVQRVSGALGLAGFTALTTAWQTQSMADRSALLTGFGPTVDPRVLAMERSGPAGLLPLWEQMQVKAVAQGYSNGFLLLGVLTFLCAGLALLLRSGRPEPGERPHVEIG